MIVKTLPVGCSSMTNMAESPAAAPLSHTDTPTQSIQSFDAVQGPRSLRWGWRWALQPAELSWFYTYYEDAEWWAKPYLPSSSSCTISRMSLLCHNECILVVAVRDFIIIIRCHQVCCEAIS